MYSVILRYVFSLTSYQWGGINEKNDRFCFVISLVCSNFAAYRKQKFKLL